MPEDTGKPSQEDTKNPEEKKKDSSEELKKLIKEVREEEKEETVVVEEEEEKKKEPEEKVDSKEVKELKERITELEPLERKTKAKKYVEEAIEKYRFAKENVDFLNKMADEGRSKAQIFIQAKIFNAAFKKAVGLIGDKYGQKARDELKEAEEKLAKSWGKTAEVGGGEAITSAEAMKQIEEDKTLTPREKIAKTEELYKRAAEKEGIKTE